MLSKLSKPPCNEAADVLPAMETSSSAAGLCWVWWGFSQLWAERRIMFARAVPLERLGGRAEKKSSAAEEVGENSAPSSSYKPLGTTAGAVGPRRNRYSKLRDAERCAKCQLRGSGELSGTKGHRIPF